LSVLDLDVDIRPCPKGGRRFLRELERVAGDATIPFLSDPNTGAQLHESDHIVKYLFDTYGTNPAPLALRLGPLTNASSKLVSLLCGGTGPHAKARAEPTLPLELWAFETDAGSRLVRTALDAHELPYTMYNVAPGSHKRRKLSHIAPEATLPYLIDPNHGAQLSGSADIVHYLTDNYGRESDRTTSYRRFMSLRTAAT
jgi:glutathione S-transferase